MARRVILVVHPRSRVLRSKVNLKVLQRYGVDLGKEIALVTADRTTRDLAYEVWVAHVLQCREGGDR